MGRQNIRKEEKGLMGVKLDIKDKLLLFLNFA